MTNTDQLVLGGCDPAIAEILVRDIERGWSDAVAYVGPQFADFEGLAIEQMIRKRKGDALALEQLGIAPQLAKALADAINGRKPA
jgi:hypothetical protein